MSTISTTAVAIVGNVKDKHVCEKMNRMNELRMLKQLHVQEIESLVSFGN